MTTETRRRLAQTQPLPTVETSADLYQTDPEHVYSHRATSATSPANQWSQEALDRRLDDMERLP